MLATTSLDEREYANILASLATAIANSTSTPQRAYQDPRQAWIYGVLCGLWGDDLSHLFIQHPTWSEAHSRRLKAYHQRVTRLGKALGVQVSPPLHRQIERAICRDRGDDDHYLTDIQPLPHLVEALSLPLGLTRIWLATTQRATCTHTPRCAWHDLIIASGTFRGTTPDMGDDGLTPDWQATAWTVLRQTEVMGLGFDELVEHVRIALRAEQEEQRATD